MSELKPADSATSSIAIQQNSRSYIPPALDQEVLRGDSMRRVRFLLEYAKAEEALRAWGCGPQSRFSDLCVRKDDPGRHAFWYEEAQRFANLASQGGGALTADGGGP